LVADSVDLSPPPQKYLYPNATAIQYTQTFFEQDMKRVGKQVETQIFLVLEASKNDKGT